MFETLSSTEGTQSDVQQGSLNTRKLGDADHAHESKWGAPYFDQPKVNTNRVRLLSEFWNLNRQLKHNSYPMPKIREILLKPEGFKYANSLNLNMVYHHIGLRKYASNLFTIIIPWGKYRKKLLPMGVSNSLGIFQEKMNKLFHGFELIRAYIDDLLITNKGDWSDQLEKLELTLQKLKENGIKCNIKELLFGKNKMAYLGLWATKNRIRPINKKL